MKVLAFFGGMMSNPQQEKGLFAAVGRIGAALMAVGSLLNLLSRLPGGCREARQAVQAIRNRPAIDAGNSQVPPIEKQ